jgi:chemotaxis protein CheC
MVAANPMFLDALKEIGNIGASQAATSLSQMIGATIRLEVPWYVMPINAVASILRPGVADGRRLQGMGGGVAGHILFLLPQDRAEYLRA